MSLLKKRRYRVKFRVFDEYTVDVYGINERDAECGAVMSYDLQRERKRGSSIRPVKVENVVKGVYSMVGATPVKDLVFKEF